MRSFTLIEMLLYLGLFSILITGAIQSLFSIRESVGRIEAQARLTDEGNFISQRVHYETGRATHLALNDDSRLTLENTEGIVAFYVSGEEFFEEIGDITYTLTEPGMYVEDVLFKVSQQTLVFSFLLKVSTSEGAYIKERYTTVAPLPYYHE